MNLLLDTDVLIFFLRGDKRIKTLLQFNDRFFCSSVTRKELLAKPGLSNRERETILSLLMRLRQIPVNSEIASLADTLYRKYRHQGLQIPDALIAATAIQKKMPLATFNRKHFQSLAELTIFPMEDL